MVAKKTAMSGFYKKTPDERLHIVEDFANLQEQDRKALRAGLDIKAADNLVENAVGTFTLPLGVATNFRINSRDYIIPMVIEEPSVIAAASAGAKSTDNVEVTVSRSHVTGQIQVLDVQTEAADIIMTRKSDIIAAAKEILSKHMSIVEMHSTNLDTTPNMIKVEIVIDAGEAMGANAINTLCEGIAPLIEEITGGRVLLRILSNAMPRMANASAYFDVEDPVAEGILNAYRFAAADRHRAVTHNKGIMNGVVAVGLATGQDTRALEAAAHAYAAESGRYSPLSSWEICQGRLLGKLSIPLGVGTRGGLTTHHATAAACLKILQNPTAGDLAGIMAAVGLCQNFSALRALATDGIQKGHMKLHKRRLT